MIGINSDCNLVYGGSPPAIGAPDCFSVSTSSAWGRGGGGHPRLVVASTCCRFDLKDLLDKLLYPKLKLIRPRPATRYPITSKVQTSTASSIALVSIFKLMMYFNGYGVLIDDHKGRLWMSRASRVRSSAWKVSNIRPGYNASDSDSDSDKLIVHS